MLSNLRSCFPYFYVSVLFRVIRPFACLHTHARAHTNWMQHSVLPGQSDQIHASQHVYILVNTALSWIVVFLLFPITAPDWLITSDFFACLTFSTLICMHSLFVQVSFWFLRKPSFILSFLLPTTFSVFSQLAGRTLFRAQQKRPVFGHSESFLLVWHFNQSINWSIDRPWVQNKLFERCRPDVIKNIPELILFPFERLARLLGSSGLRC